MPDLEVQARDRPCGGLLQGDLPTGCGMCTKGAKMVLFVTGVCHYDCFYCPVGDQRRMNEGAWANERWIPPEDVGTGDDLEAIAQEARATRAYGTGLTGGDPMYDPERTLRFIRFLKDEFGDGHHIHIYTQIPFDEAWLPKLQEAGLDEPRFHPPEEIWDDVDAHPAYASLYREALELDWDVGFEIPCIPGWGDEILALARWLDDAGVPFLNLNEFEFSETNFREMKARGHAIKDDVTSKAEGSAELARELMKATADMDLTVHFCSSPFKDAIQLRARLRRRAEETALPHEVATDDGTLLRGVVHPGGDDPEDVARQLMAELDVPEELVHLRDPDDAHPSGPPTTPTDGKGAPRPQALGGVATTGRSVGVPAVQREGEPAGTAASPQLDPDQPRLEVAPWILQELGHALPWDCWISEVYPTADELEVERIPVTEGMAGIELD